MAKNPADARKCPYSSKHEFRSGFTLLELLVVVTILGLLAAIVTPQVIKYVGSSRTETAHIQILNIVSALELFHIDVHRYPTPEEGLAALITKPQVADGWNGSYLKRASGIIDPWGVPYSYRTPGQHGDVDVWSFGADKTEGGTAESRDVNSWE